MRGAASAALTVKAVGGELEKSAARRHGQALDGMQIHAEIDLRGHLVHVLKDPRSEFHADVIFAELPACRVIHMVRDPRAVLASQRAAWGRRSQGAGETAEADRLALPEGRYRGRGSPSGGLSGAER
jgi:hypothetical protein